MSPRHAVSRAPSWIFVVYVVAAVNLAVGARMSLEPARLSDFDQVTTWAAQWLAGGDVYAAASVTDYPPWSIVVLSPLALVSREWQAPLWVALNLGLAGLLVARLVRVSGERASIQMHLAALLLATAAFRTLNQFSLLSFLLALTGATSRSRVIGGLLLGLSLIKPQVGGVVALWVLLGWHPRRFVVAVAVPVLLSLIFAQHAGVSALTIAAEYWQVLTNIYGGTTPFAGHTDLRPWIAACCSGVPTGLWVSALVALVLITPALVRVARRPKLSADDRLELLAFCGVVSLLSVRHLSYDFILLLPLLVAWRSSPFSSRRADRGRHWLFIGLALALIIELPGWSRRVAAPLGAPEALTAILNEVDRVLCVAIWVVLAIRTMKSRS